MKSSLFAFIFLTLFAGRSVLAQDDEPYKGEQTDSTEVVDEEGPFYIGGGIGLQFGNVTNILISPHVGYYVTEDFSVGLGLQYQYYKQNAFSNGVTNFPEYETSIYGGSVFGRYDVVENLFLHTEFEALNLDVQNNVGGLARETIPTLFLGAGYKQGNKFSHVYITALYDVLQEPGSPYARSSTFGIEGLVLRVGVNIGL